MNSRRTRLRSAIAVISTVLVLVPSAVLFARVWTDVSDRRAATALEKQGVEYLTALSPLISALAEAQSSALQGVDAPPASLAAATSRVSAADARLGDALKTRQRWAGLQEKLGKLSKVTGGQVAVYQAHVEVTDLALGLYNAIRRSSELNRDPDSDLSNLQQAAAVDMPTTIVLASRMGDLANMLQSATGATRAAITVQFGEQVLAVQTSVNALTENLQAAVDDTTSPTLSGSLVSSLDSFRRGVESMARGANPGGPPNIATISTAQSSLQTALTGLAGVVLKEMARLLDNRMDNLGYRRVEALTMGLLAVVLVLAALIGPAFSRRRGAAARPAGDNRAAGSPPDSSPNDQVPAYGQADPIRRERSGALR